MRALILALALLACSPAPQAEQPIPAPQARQQAPETGVTPVAPAQAEANQAANLARMPNWQNARTAGVDFRGVGQEPGWLIDIYRENRIVLMWDYGESLVEFPLPAPTYPQEGATRYDTRASQHSLHVAIRRAPCQDAMSGEAFPATVEIVIDGRTLSGCGRSV